MEGDNIRYKRHPLAFLVEAADDICYTIIDFEDGINLGLIQEEFALYQIRPIMTQ
jgi:dGTPase